MRRHVCGWASACALSIALAVMGAVTGPAAAQKSGGILKISFFDSPASMSLHEEATGAALRPMMGVFNNLVMYDQQQAQNQPDTIVPDLAESWTWSEDGKELTFQLRQGVKWHDGKPFTAADVKCTWELLLGTAPEKLRVNPRKTWYLNLEKVTTNGDYEATFHLKRPQPAFLSLLAAGWSPVYPCHVPAKDMRTKPIGTGPFKFVEFRPNEVVKTARNPDYWKPGRPYLDGIEWQIMPEHRDPQPRVHRRQARHRLALRHDRAAARTTSSSRRRRRNCVLTSTNVSRNLILNPEKPPFDNPELRRAVALSLDRKAFIDIIQQGKGDIGATMLPPPEGLWGMPPEMLATLPGYDPDVAKNRAEARKIMEKLGYGPDKRLSVTLSSRNIPTYRQPAVILIDQAEGDLYRRDARAGRDRQLVPEDLSQGLHDRRSTAPRAASTIPTSSSTKISCAARCATTPAIATRGRQADRPAIGRVRRRKAQAAGVGDRAAPGRGRRAADHLLPARRHLHAALRQGARDDGQQHLQRLPDGRRLARQIARAEGELQRDRPDAASLRCPPDPLRRGPARICQVIGANPPGSGGALMRRGPRLLAASCGVVAAIAAPVPPWRRNRAAFSGCSISPARPVMSIHEESTIYRRHRR